MCGIFGAIATKKSYINKKQFKKLLDNLFILSETRGKEASGIALVSSGNIKVYKTSLSASRMIKKRAYRETFDDLSTSQCLTAIGHSRLVTNGNQEFNENNQPVIKSDMVGIHNGIVVNVDSLWEKYSDEEKKSDLDSEIILTLIKRFFTEENSMKIALQKTYGEIYGMASIALLFNDFDNMLLATNNGSLYFAVGNDGESFVFASEAFILQSLMKKKTIKRFFNADSIRRLEPQNALSVQLNDFTIDSQTYTVDSKFNDFTNLINCQKQLEIKDISDKTTDYERLSNFCAAGVVVHVPDRFIRHYDKCRKIIGEMNRCSKCLLPETFPFILFDDKNVCNYCRNYKKIEHKGHESLMADLEPFRKRDGTPDCIVTFSGGRDSSFGLHYIKTELGMNPISYSYDWGMITDLARRNQSRLCGKLCVEHILVSADIQKKRRNIRKNVLAWLKRPNLGTVPLFMAGDKQYFYHANRLGKQNDIQLLILCENLLETTRFKSGFCGIQPLFNTEHTYTLSMSDQMKMVMFYCKEYLLSPSYLNTSMLDTIGAFLSYYFIPHDYLNMYQYIRWDETTIEDVLINEYDWELSPDTRTTWRIGDGTASFYNYIYYIISGFSENDTFRSNQIREGMLERQKAFALVNDENTPRFESIKWYCDTIGIDFEAALMKINEAPKLY